MKLKTIRTYEHKSETTLVFEFTAGDTDPDTYLQRSVVIRPRASAEEVGQIMIQVGRKILEDQEKYRIVDRFLSINS